VFCLRWKHKKHDLLMKERNHEGLPVESFGLKSCIRALLFPFSHPIMFLSLLWWVISACRMRPKHLFKSLILIPSVLSICSILLKKRADVVHLFWGHYPSMRGYLVNSYMPETVLSMFLGAHDLVSAYPGSVKLAAKADVVVTHAQSNLAM